MSLKTTVCHISSVHYRYENRILLKDCVSLKEAGYEVYYIVADGKGDEEYNGVRIIDVGKYHSRYERFFKTAKLLRKKALDLGCDIIHFHDPELVFAGSKLIRRKKKVIFDIHEEVSEQIKAKVYLNNLQKRLLANIYKFIEKKFVKKFSYNIAANPVTYNRLKQFCDKVELINNYPLIIENIPVWDQREDSAFYIGSLMENRGLFAILDAALLTDIKIKIVGDFKAEETKRKAMAHPGWKKIEYYGRLPWVEAAKLAQKSKYGLVPFHVKNSYLSFINPSKLFEYMMLGLAVVITNHREWSRIIERHQCGVNIPEPSGKEIAKALEFLKVNDTVAKEMSANARKAAIEHFNWEVEKQKLLSVYKKLQKLKYEIFHCRTCV